MQCHGGLKGPLRRIIRSLGNDRVSSAYRSSPQRHFIERATSSPPERCIPHRDDRTDSSFNGTLRPRPDAPTTRNGRLNQSTPLASHSEPEPKEEQAQNDPRTISRDDPKELSSIDASSNSTSPTTDQGVIKRYMVDSPAKDSRDFSNRYRSNIRRVTIDRRKNESRAHEIQQERHNYASSDDWRVILRMLDDSTIASPHIHKKRLETVMLPKGVLARFNSNAGVCLLEIVEHTGCHVQIARGEAHCSKVADAFAGLDLLGSSMQITQALKILPQYLDVMSAEELIGVHASGNLNDHVLERRIRSGEEMRLASLSAPGNAYQQEAQSYDESDVERIEDELDKEKGRSTAVASPVRSIWAADRFRKLDVDEVLDQRPRSISTSLEFSAYVADLCQRVSRDLSRVLPTKRMPLSEHGHVQNMIKKLVSLFSTPGVASIATSHAVDRAIKYLTKHNNFAAFREVYKALEDGGYVFTSSNWNCCLAAAAKHGDVHNYRYTLKVMLRHKIHPNPVTWATLHELMCRRFPSEASFVAETMRNRGLLWDRNAAQLVAQNSVANDLKAHLALGGNLATFLRFYDNRFSSIYRLESFDWLTIGPVNRMIAVLVALGRTRDAFRVLHEFRERNGERAFETTTLNTFLTSSLRDLDPASAVSILQHFRVGQPGALIPDNVTFTILFAIAWRRRYYNMLRVIWRYACAAGQIGFSMRYRIKGNLNCYLSSENLVDNPVGSRGQVWRALAAKFAIGLSVDSAHHEDNKTEGTTLNALELDMVALTSLGSLPKGSPEFESRRNFFRSVAVGDFNEVGLGKPVLPLAELLKSAWEKDRDWKERGLGLPRNYNTDTFKEMLEDGIKVPIEKGDGTLETRAWEVPSLLRRAPSAEFASTLEQVANDDHEEEDEEGEASATTYKPIV